MAKPDEETVTIPKAEYEQLLEDQKAANWLTMLEGAGVDNWGGYSFAYELKEQAIADGEFTEEDFP